MQCHSFAKTQLGQCFVESTYIMYAVVIPH